MSSRSHLSHVSTKNTLEACRVIIAPSIALLLEQAVPTDLPTYGIARKYGRSVYLWGL